MTGCGFNSSLTSVTSSVGYAYIYTNKHEEEHKKRKRIKVERRNEEGKREKHLLVFAFVNIITYKY